METITSGIDRNRSLLRTKDTSSRPLMSGMLMSVTTRSKCLARQHAKRLEAARGLGDLDRHVELLEGRREERSHRRGIFDDQNPLHWAPLREIRAVRIAGRIGRRGRFLRRGKDFGPIPAPFLHPRARRRAGWLEGWEGPSGGLRLGLGQGAFQRGPLEGQADVAGARPRGPRCRRGAGARAGCRRRAAPRRRRRSRWGRGRPRGPPRCRAAPPSCSRRRRKDRPARDGACRARPAARTSCGRRARPGAARNRRGRLPCAGRAGPCRSPCLPAP